VKRMGTWLVLVTGIALAACESKPPPPPQPSAEELTVGKVQGEIKVGMDAASVAQILGSPNIVTTDEKRREVWIYDKVSTDRVDEDRLAGGTIIVLFGRKETASSSSRQRTLTILIKFDEAKKVRDFAYNYSQF
jgi:outer membrane protein assembly factor BamE (lipoprotein component of BamABCDE complex)